MDLVTAVITTHGRLELFKKALESAENQSYPNMEIIVVDDCSADGTKAWMSDDYKGKAQYIYIPKEESKGGNHARNVGIKASRGDYIAFLDDDDIWKEDKITKQVKALECNDKAVITYCGYTKYFDNGERQAFIPTENEYGDLSVKIFTKIFFTTSMMLVKKSALEQIGCFDENLRFWQDYDLELRICQLGPVECVTESLVDILCSTSKSDPTRLSTKIDGWMEAVNYINIKYDSQIEKLPDDMKKQRELLICFDGVSRCASIGDRKQQRQFLKKAFEVQPNFKNLLKYILNPDPQRALLAKEKFKSVLRR